jgi:hypothetical protein
MLKSTEDPNVDITAKRRVDAGRKPESLDGARLRFAKLLRARIAETERTLVLLRAELASVGGNDRPAARRTMNCAVCGQSGHTKRTCPQAGKGKDAQVSANRA